MVHHTVYSHFNVVARNHAGFNSLLKAAEEAGIIEVIRPKVPMAPKTKTVPASKVRSRPLWRRRQAGYNSTESEIVATRLRPREDGEKADCIPEGNKEKNQTKDVTRSIVKGKNSMVLRRRRRRFLSRKRVNQQTKCVKATNSKAPEKIPRESVPETDFQMNELDWSSWKVAVAPKTQKRLASSTWAPRREGPGMRNIGLFGGKTDVPAVYEFAVQPPDSDAKYPVQFKTTKGFSKGNWDAKLMNDLPTERQLDRVIRRGCKVYARRARLSLPVKNGKTVTGPLDELKSLIGQCYDYAWRQHYQVNTRRYVHRNVTVDGVKISDNPDWKRL